MLRGKFSFHASEQTSIGEQRKRFKSDNRGESYLPGQTVTNAIILKNNGNPKHLLAMSHLGDGTCVGAHWVNSKSLLALYLR